MYIDCWCKDWQSAKNDEDRAVKQSDLDVLVNWAHSNSQMQNYTSRTKEFRPYRQNGGGIISWKAVTEKDIGVVVEKRLVWFLDV